MRIERIFCESLKNILLAPRAAAANYFWTGDAAPPPTNISQRADADTMTSAQGSITN